jgi:hypothetical protein
LVDKLVVFAEKTPQITEIPNQLARPSPPSSQYSPPAGRPESERHGRADHRLKYKKYDTVHVYGYTKNRNTEELPSLLKNININITTFTNPSSVTSKLLSKGQRPRRRTLRTRTCRTSRRRRTGRGTRARRRNLHNPRLRRFASIQSRKRRRPGRHGIQASETRRLGGLGKVQEDGFVVHFEFVVAAAEFVAVVDVGREFLDLEVGEVVGFAVGAFLLGGDGRVGAVDEVSCEE